MHPADPSLAKLRRERNTERAAFLAVIAALFIALVTQWRSPKPCVLSVGGAKIGYVSNPRIAQQAKTELEKRYRSKLGGEVLFKDEVMWYPDRPSEKASFLTLSEAVAALERKVKPIVKAVAVEVDGQPLLVVKSKSMADDVLRQFMGQYVDPNAPSHEVPKTREVVNLVPVEGVDARQVVTKVDEALKELAASGRTEQVYVVQDGDTGYRAAAKNSLSLEALAELNPGVDLAKLRVGQRLCVQRAKSPLTVVTVHETTRVEKIPYPTRTVRSKGMPSGTRKVEQAGKDGQREVTYRITCENGVPLKKEPVGEARLITRPETRVIVEGAG